MYLVYSALLIVIVRTILHFRIYWVATIYGKYQLVRFDNVNVLETHARETGKSLKYFI